MSELTQCNYCSLQRIKTRAKENKCYVLKFKSHEMQGLGGYDIFVVPNGEKLSKKNKDKYFVSWMMEIGTECEC